ncbi:MAG: GyrI-like domain-containing protein [Firmicutes bacterium]|nr:GyrI-like domain-containing protein [Bacillota bacterium]
MSYNVEFKDIEPIRVATIRYEGHVKNASKVFPKVFKAVKGKLNGAPFFNYYEMNQDTKIGKMELCVPTEEEPNGNGVRVKYMPRIKALCVTHIGPYETLCNAYEAIDQYVQENPVILQPPFREIFIKGPGMIMKGNPNKYITEIQFPLKEEE